MRTLLLSVCLWSTCLFSSISSASEFPIILDPVVNATPPGAAVTAGYLTLINETSSEIVITGAYSPTIAKVEIHRSIIKDDVAKMELQDSVSLAPGATVKFEHGGYHLMLMALTKPLEEGQSVDIILSTSVGDMLIEMPVQKLGAPMEGHQHSEANKPAKTDEAAESEVKMEENHQTHSNDKEQVSSK